MLHSCESLLTAIFAVGGGAIFGATAIGDGVAAGDVTIPGVAGAVCAGRLGCPGGTVGFGPEDDHAKRKQRSHQNPQFRRELVLLPRPVHECDSGRNTSDAVEFVGISSHFSGTGS